MTSAAIGLEKERLAGRLAGKWMAGLASGCAVIAAALSIPPLRSVIEQSMAWHMVFQMPLLVLSGALACAALPLRIGRRPLARLAAFNQYGLTGFMAGQIIVAYWMLPVAIDRAVVQPPFDVIKIVTLFVSGLLLADAFKRAPSVLQLFFVGYAVSMMCWLGIYFATTDLRLCNAYSLDSQITTGWRLLALGVLLGVAWLAHAWRTAAQKEMPG